MPRRRLLAILFAAMAIFFGTDLFVLAQDSSTQAAPAQPNGAALVVKGKRLITFYVPLDGLSPEERVERAAIVLRDLSQKSDFTIDELKSVDGTMGQDIIGGGMRIATNYTSLRDGNTPSIPADKLPAGFVSPKFQVENSAPN